VGLVRTLACTIAASLLLAGVAEAAGAAERRPPTCERAGSKTVLKNRAARVFEVKGAQTRLYGCLKSVGKRIKLTETYDDDLYESTSYGDVRLAGRFVAWQEVFSDVSCKAACPPGYDATRETIEVYDLKRRQRRYVSGAVLTHVLLLTDGGSAAWAQRASDGQVEVRVLRGRKSSVIDKGNIAARSLLLRGDTLVWVKDGAQRSTPLP
jgi:hypothetical protein